MDEATEAWRGTRDTQLDGDRRHRDADTAALLGAALSGANPKNLALTLAASASIAEAGLDDADTAVALLVFIAIGSVTVAGSVLFYLIDAQSAARPLAAVKQFMSDNNAVIMMVVLLLLGQAARRRARRLVSVPLRPRSQALQTDPRGCQSVILATGESEERACLRANPNRRFSSDSPA